MLGLRPAYGRVPVAHRRGLHAAAWAWPARWRARRRDLAALLAVQAGYDPRVPMSIRQDPAGFLGPLERDLTGLRIGWLGDLDGHLPMEEGVLALCREALEAFEGLGAVVEDASLGFDPEIGLAGLDEAALLAGRPRRCCRSPADPARRGLLKPEARWEVEQGLKLSGLGRDAGVRPALGLVPACRRGLFERYDMLVLPSAQLFPFAVETHWPREIAGPAHGHLSSLDGDGDPGVTMSGCPAMNVPAGFNAAGLPMGMQLWGPNQSERLLLELVAGL